MGAVNSQPEVTKTPQEIILVPPTFERKRADSWPLHTPFNQETKSLALLISVNQINLFLFHSVV